MGHHLDRPRREFLLRARRAAASTATTALSAANGFKLGFTGVSFPCSWRSAAARGIVSTPSPALSTRARLIFPGPDGRSAPFAIKGQPCRSSCVPALSRFTVLDLTRVRAGPTCVRQLADWGADVIKIEMPGALDEGEALGGPRDGPDFQNLHRNKRGITLNLKPPEGVAMLQAAGRQGRRGGRELPPRREDAARHRLRDACARSTRASSTPASRASARTAPTRDRPGFDQIAQGMGGLMSITGLPGQGPVRVGIPIADLCAGLFCALGILVALLEREQSGQGPVGADLAAAGADLHARLPGRALAHATARCRSRPATTTRPAIPTGVFKTARRLHQHRRRRARRSGSASASAIGAPGAARRIRTTRPRALRSKNRDALERRDRTRRSPNADQRRLDRALQRGRRALRPDLRDRRGRSPTRRCSTSASRSRCAHEDSATSRWSASR